MLRLRTKGTPLNNKPSHGYFFSEGLREGRPPEKEICIVDVESECRFSDLHSREWSCAIFFRDPTDAEVSCISAIDFFAVRVDKEKIFIGPGDVIHVNSANNNIVNVHRVDSSHNSLFATEECNSNCIMCSQPPRIDGVETRVNDLLEHIEMIPRSCENIGITGGEPLLLGKGYLKIIESIRERFGDSISTHVLTNGRLFYYSNIAKDCAEYGPSDCMYGVPLYSDNPVEHDFITQSEGSFRETTIGLHNMAAYNLDVEIRMVLQKGTYERLPQWAEFVTKNFPFARHVALMGLEIMGHTNKNRSSVWVDPVDYLDQLREACAILDRARMKFSIYNLPLCLLPEDIWPWARQSISDWKNDFFPECESCCVNDSCSGAFTSGLKLHSRGIQPFEHRPRMVEEVGSR
jgi:His-Xaa-Ser system radical SAM maturase HxsC